MARFKHETDFSSLGEQEIFNRFWWSLNHSDDFGIVYTEFCIELRILNLLVGSHSSSSAEA